MATAAEDVGFDSLWVGDHLLYHLPDGPRGPWEAWSLLAALAAVTERVQLGPLVASTSFHNPAMLAKKAATVDEIAGGRLIVGLGAGWNRTEYDAYGIPFDHRVSRFGEAFSIIRSLLRDGHVDFTGEYYEARDCDLVPRPRPGGPPLMVGSTGARMLELTLPHVDMWNAWHAWFGNNPRGLAELISSVDTATEAVGRHPAEVAKTAAVLVQAPGGKGRVYGDDEHATSIPITGDQDSLADQLAAFATTGVAHLQLVVDPITIESIEWLGPVLDRLDHFHSGRRPPLD